jgi:hypothetical protein
MTEVSRRSLVQASELMLKHPLLRRWARAVSQEPGRVSKEPRCCFSPARDFR